MLSTIRANAQKLSIEQEGLTKRSNDGTTKRCIYSIYLFYFRFKIFARRTNLRKSRTKFHFISAQLYQAGLFRCIFNVKIHFSYRSSILHVPQKYLIILLFLRYDLATTFKSTLHDYTLSILRAVLLSLQYFTYKRNIILNGNYF